MKAATEEALIEMKETLQLLMKKVKDYKNDERKNNKMRKNIKLKRQQEINDEM